MKRLTYKELLFNYRLFRDLMDNVPDVIYFKDRKGRLVLVNRAHARGLGLDAKKVEGLTDYDIFPGKRAAVMSRDDQYVMTTGKPIIDKVERSTRADGVDNYVSTTKVPRYDSKGHVTGIMGITRDVTHRMQLLSLRQESDRIKEKLDSLQEMDKMRTDFLAVVSRQLSGPVDELKIKLRGLLKARGAGLSARHKELVVAAADSAQKLQKTVSELIDIARIERGRTKLNYSLADLNSLINEVVLYYERAARAKGLDLSCHVPKDQINILADAGRISQVVSSLLDNAVKFTEPGGKVNAGLEIFGDTARVCVADTGIGIPKQQLPRLFERFVRGVGLDLSITRDIIGRHGGVVWVESTPGVGSKFYFILPNIYSIGRIDRAARGRVNHLLEGAGTVHLASFSIVDGKALKKKLKPGKIDPVAGLTRALKSALKEYGRRNRKKLEVFCAGITRSRYNIFMPGSTNKDSLALCGFLKDAAQRYFIKNMIDYAFVNVAVMDFAPSLQQQGFEKAAPDVRIERMRIGLEKRYFERRRRDAGLQVIPGGQRARPGRVLDISGGGICFGTGRHLEPDTNLRIKLELPGQGRFLPAIAGRLVWIKETAGPGHKYVAGLEFVRLSRDSRLLISKFIAQKLSKHSGSPV